MEPAIAFHSIDAAMLEASDVKPSAVLTKHIPTTEESNFRVICSLVREIFLMTNRSSQECINVAPDFPPDASHVYADEQLST